MAIAYGLVGQLIKSPTRKERVNAFAALVMWFAAGAFISSTLNVYITQIPDGLGPDLLGGLVGLGIGTFLKAV